MKSIIALVIGAAALALLGTECLGVSRLDVHMADAQQQLATLQYDAARESLTEAEQYADHARWVPWFGRDERREIRARTAAVKYWQRQYEAAESAQAEAVSGVDDNNVELELVAANAAYRVGQTQWKDKASTTKALEDAATRYLGALRNNTWHADAAFNYEYVVHLRDELDKGKLPPPPPITPGADNGKPGGPSPTTRSRGFQIIVPLEKGEKDPLGGEAGKLSPRDRKG